MNLEINMKVTLFQEMEKKFLIVFILLTGIATSEASLKDCDDGVKCIKVTPKLSSGQSYTFDCHMVEDQYKLI